MLVWHGAWECPEALAAILDWAEANSERPVLVLALDYSPLPRFISWARRTQVTAAEQFDADLVHFLLLQRAIERGGAWRRHAAKWWNLLLPATLILGFSVWRYYEDERVDDRMVANLAPSSAGGPARRAGAALSELVQRSLPASPDSDAVRRAYIDSVRQLLSAQLESATIEPGNVNVSFWTVRGEDLVESYTAPGKSADVKLPRGGKSVVACALAHHALVEWPSRVGRRPGPEETAVALYRLDTRVRDPLPREDCGLQPLNRSSTRVVMPSRRCSGLAVVWSMRDVVM